MAKELDLTGVDEILAEDKNEKELDLSGVDDILAEDEPSIGDSVKEFASDFVNAPSPLGPSLKETGETVADFAIGAGKGAMMGGVDEVGGMLGAGLEKVLSYVPGTGAYENRQVDNQLEEQGFNIPEESFLDTYDQYADGIEQFQKESELRSPTANFVGDLAGSMSTGIAGLGKLGVNAATKAKPIMDVMKDSGKMKAALELMKRGGTTAVKAAPLLAAESTLRSENDLVGENAKPMELLKDVGDNMAFGVPAILGLDAVTEVAAPLAKKAVKGGVDYVDDALKDNPFVRKMKKSFEFGEEGILPITETNIGKLEAKQLDNAGGLLNQIKAADKKLGKEVGASLEAAEQSGTLIDVNQVVDKVQDALRFTYENYHEMGMNSRGKQILDKISKASGDMFESLNAQTGEIEDVLMSKRISPLEAKTLLDDIDSFIGKFKASNNRTTQENNIMETLMKTRKELSNTMKDQIEGYRKASQRFEEFRRTVPETVISGRIPTDISEVFMGNLKNPEKKLLENLEILSTGATAQGSSGKPVRQAMTQLERSMDELATNSMKRGDAIPLDTKKFTKDIRDFSDEAQMLTDMQTVKGQFADTDKVGAQIFQLGRGGALVTANIAGHAAPHVGKLSRKIYNMPAEKLNQVADTLMNVPGLSKYGTALKQGLANGDQAKKNAAIFAMMQNPSARIFLDDNEEEN